MTKWRWVWSLLTLASLAAFAGHALADRGSGQGSIKDKRQDSHILDKLPDPPSDLEDLLKHGRSGQLLEEILKGLQEKGTDPEKVKELQKMLQTQKGREQFHNLLNNNPRVKDLLKGTTITPDQVESILKGELSEEIQESSKRKTQQDRSSPLPPKPPAAINNPQTQTDAGTSTEASSTTQGPFGIGRVTEGTGRVAQEERTASTRASQQTQTAGSAFKERLVKLAEGLHRLDPSLGDSPAVKRAIQQLSQQMGVEDQRWDRFAAAAGMLQEKTRTWSESLGLNRLRAGKNWSWPKALTPSSLPQINWPSVASALRERPNLPSTASAPPTSGWSGLLAVVGLLIFGFLFWRFLSRSSDLADSKGRSAWKLGPWPVQPAAIRTREELIRAFEYLSLLNLGPVARHWNHRTIAGRLGDLPAILSEEYQRRLAAEELAALYEQARYAPQSEPLPEGALAAARNDLCLLARMPAA